MLKSINRTIYKKYPFKSTQRSIRHTIWSLYIESHIQKKIKRCRATGYHIEEWRHLGIKTAYGGPILYTCERMKHINEAIVLVCLCSWEHCRAIIILLYFKGHCSEDNYFKKRVHICLGINICQVLILRAVKHWHIIKGV